MNQTTPIVLETAEERLWIGDRPEQLTRVAFRLLQLFIESEGKLVTKRHILRDVWPDTNVSDASVKDSVKNLRATLGDSAAKPLFIETVRGRGYRFLGGIDVVDRMVEDMLPPTEPVMAAIIHGVELNIAPPAKSTQPAEIGNGWRVMAACIAAIGIAFFISLTGRVPDDLIPARQDRMAFAIPDKPSIAVTPFLNASGDSGHDWLSMGLSSSVIAALTTSPDMVVISQNALDAMSNTRPGEIAERYGVRYVLDGTIQVDGEELRISARLADAIAGRTLWSENWDKGLDDIFLIQDEIADAILEELQVRLTIGEQARSWRVNTGTPENMRALIVGRGAFQTFTPEGHARAAQLWNAMYDRNPELPISMLLQGWLAWHKVVVGLSTDPVADLNATKAWAQQAIDAGLGGSAHVLYATAASYLGQNDLALEYAEQAIIAAPGEADVVMISGTVLAGMGHLDKGIHLMQRGMRLEPDYPDWLAASMKRALLKVGRWQDARDLAIQVIEKDVPDVNARFSALITLVVLSVWQEKPEDAGLYLSALMELRPDVTVAQIKTGVRYLEFSNNASEPDFQDRYLAALVEAGMPEGE